MIKLSFVFLLSIGLLSACNVEHKDNEGGEIPAETTYSTYEMIEGCSTGVKKFNGNNEKEQKSAFCNGLKSNEANGNCAQYQREMTFKAYSCEGNWPHASVSGTNFSSSQQYEYKVNSCSTGFHYISSSNSELGQKAFCRTLMDDNLNMNCARSKREESYAEAGCNIL